VPGKLKRARGTRSAQNRFYTGVFATIRRPRVFCSSDRLHIDNFHQEKLSHTRDKQSHREIFFFFLSSLTEQECRCNKRVFSDSNFFFVQDSMYRYFFLKINQKIPNYYSTHTQSRVRVFRLKFFVHCWTFFFGYVIENLKMFVLQVNSYSNSVSYYEIVRFGNRKQSAWTF